MAAKYPKFKAPQKIIKSSLSKPNSIIYGHKMNVYKMFDPIFSNQQAKMRREKLLS